MKTNQTQAVLARVRAELRKQGVDAKVIEAAVAEARRDRMKPAPVKRETVKTIRRLLKRIGDKVVVSWTASGVHVHSMQGFLNLQKNVHRARTVKNERKVAATEHARKQAEGIKTEPIKGHKS